MKITLEITIHDVAAVDAYENSIGIQNAITMQAEKISIRDDKLYVAGPRSKARRTINKYGARAFIDHDTGQVAVVKNGKLTWSKSTCVKLIMPTLSEALDHPEAFARMITALALPEIRKSNDADRFTFTANQVCNLAQSVRRAMWW